MDSNIKYIRFYPILVYCLAPIIGLSMDMYLPSLPSMVKVFDTNTTTVQLTITSYVLAMGIGQFLAGPLSDAWGRKRFICISLFIECCSIIFILLSPSIYWMLFARFIQGLSVAFMIVPARAILSDILDKDELKKHYNYLTISVAMAPIMAPFIGGYTQDYFNWQASFILLLAYLILMLIISIFVLSETLPQKKVFSPSHLWNNYKMLILDRRYIGFAIFAGLLYGYTAIFNVTAPFIFQSLFHFSAIEYGYIALFAGGAWFAGNMTNRFLLEVDLHKKFNLALTISSIVAVAFLALAWLGYSSPYLIAAAAYLLIGFTAFMFPNSVTICLSSFPEIAASSNACFFTMNWLAFSAYTAVGTQLKLHSLVWVAVGFLFVNIISQLVYRGFIKGK